MSSCTSLLKLWRLLLIPFTNCYACSTGMNSVRFVNFVSPSNSRQTGPNKRSLMTVRPHTRSCLTAPPVPPKPLLPIYPGPALHLRSFKLVLYTPVQLDYEWNVASQTGRAPADVRARGCSSSHWRTIARVRPRAEVWNREQGNEIPGQLLDGLVEEGYYCTARSKGKRTGMAEAGESGLTINGRSEFNQFSSLVN